MIVAALKGRTEKKFWEKSSLKKTPEKKTPLKEKFF